MMDFDAAVDHPSSAVALAVQATFERRRVESPL